MKYDLRKIMKRAWEVARKAKTTMAQALKFAWKIAKKEWSLKDEWGRYDGTVTFNIWVGYGHVRAYYKCGWYSNYANSKKSNFVEM